jgi:hypothetical protein
MRVNNELEDMWKEAIVRLVRVRSGILLDSP